MFKTAAVTLFLVVLLAIVGTSTAQSNYQVVSLSNAGTITGTVKWSGPMPRALSLPDTKDPQICDPES
jgi:hypothetical protein